jgi:aryl-alcohol dehydrogenase-like predicted oxidoreductase
MVTVWRATHRTGGKGRDPRTICDGDKDTTQERRLAAASRNAVASTVIPGMRSVRNVERNCQVSDGRGLPDEMLRKLKAHRWDRNFYE